MRSSGSRTYSTRSFITPATHSIPSATHERIMCVSDASDARMRVRVSIRLPACALFWVGARARVWMCAHAEWVHVPARAHERVCAHVHGGAWSDASGTVRSMLFSNLSSRMNPVGSSSPTCPRRSEPPLGAIACTSGAAAAPRKSYTSSSSSFLSCASVGLTPSERMIVPISLQ